MRALATTELTVFPLCLGGNVFGWTADEPQSFAVLDAYVAAGGNFIDTADGYSSWAPGNRGGESEAIIGNWLVARGNRDDLVIATKVGKGPGAEGLAPATIRRAAEASLARLRTDRIDLYYAHMDDTATPLADTLAAFGELIAEGKVRHIAASNYEAPRLVEALELARSGELPAYVAIQPNYNLVHREGYEGALAELCLREGVACVPYFALASGFLTGKYRVGGPDTGSPRAGTARGHLGERGLAVLAALDEIAADRATTVAAVALAWLAAQPTVTAPIASARTPEQLADLLPVAGLALSDAELQRLSAASAA
jgi:aryl-alcohol dehydrogenase-like predicted oxidoreductase